MSNAPPSWLSKNTLLSVLPASSLALFDGHMEPIECDLRRVLASAGEPMKFVFFPTDGCVSMIRRLVDGKGGGSGACRPRRLGRPARPDGQRRQLCRCSGTGIGDYAPNFC